MMKKTLMFICCICTIFYGCARIEYILGGVTYDSLEKALRAQQDDYEHIISRINPIKNSLPYRALIVLPSESVISENTRSKNG